jgi:hypothetical protein
LPFDLLTVRVWIAGEGESSRLKKEKSQKRGGDREEGVTKNRWEIQKDSKILSISKVESCGRCKKWI